MPGFSSILFPTTQREGPCSCVETWSRLCHACPCHSRSRASATLPSPPTSETPPFWVNPHVLRVRDHFFSRKITNCLATPLASLPTTSLRCSFYVDAGANDVRSRRPFSPHGQGLDLSESRSMQLTSSTHTSPIDEPPKQARCQLCMTPKSQCRGCHSDELLLGLGHHEIKTNRIKGERGIIQQGSY